MKPTLLQQARRLSLPFLILGFGLASAHAQAPAQALYQQECAACHIAYPPGMLPAAPWSRLMGGLQKHFGADASLDAKSTEEIAAWLKTQAGTFRHVRDEPPHDRITQSRWFVNQHEEVGSSVWKRASVKNASNCGACHSNAAKGKFSEHEVHIPK